MLTCDAYIPNLVSIFACSTYWAKYKACEVLIAVGCVLAHMWNCVGSICQFSILAVWLTFAVYCETQSGHVVVILGERLPMVAAQVCKKQNSLSQ